MHKRLWNLIHWKAFFHKIEPKKWTEPKAFGFGVPFVLEKQEHFIKLLCPPVVLLYFLSLLFFSNGMIKRKRYTQFPYLLSRWQLSSHLSHEQQLKFLHSHSPQHSAAQGQLCLPFLVYLCQCHSSSQIRFSWWSYSRWHIHSSHTLQKTMYRMSFSRVEKKVNLLAE